MQIDSGNLEKKKYFEHFKSLQFRTLKYIYTHPKQKKQKQKNI